MLNPGLKSAQNGPKMAPKWPPNGHHGPFRARQRAIWGPFWVRFGTQVPTTLINVSYNAQTEAFVASFGLLGILGTGGALLRGLLVASEPLLGLLEPIWAYPGGTVWCLLDPIWASAGGKLPSFGRLEIRVTSSFDILVVTSESHEGGEWSSPPPPNFSWVSKKKIRTVFYPLGSAASKTARIFF